MSKPEPTVSSGTACPILRENGKFSGRKVLRYVWGDLKHDFAKHVVIVVGAVAALYGGTVADVKFNDARVTRFLLKVTDYKGPVAKP